MELTELVYRTVFVYFVVLIVIRLMGKREIGQLSPFDFVVAIIIAEIAAMPMQSPSFPIWHSIVPMLVVAFLEIGLSFAALHSRGLRTFLDGRPQVVINNGMILKEELRRARYNLDDLMAQLRERGYPRPDDVEVAVLETSGRLSVVPKSGKRPVTPEDLGLTTGYEGLPAVVIMDGEICREHIQRHGYDVDRLMENLKDKGIEPGKVFLATMEKDGSIIINGAEHHSAK